MSFNTHAGLWEKLYYKLFLSTQVYHGCNAMVEGDGGGGGGGGGLGVKGLGTRSTIEDEAEYDMKSYSRTSMRDHLP